MGTVRPRPMQVATRGRVGQRLGDSFVRIRPLYGIIYMEGLEWNGLEWNHEVEWSGVDFNGL